MPVSQGAIILGALAAFFFCMMCVSAGLKYYFGKKAEEDEANKTAASDAWAPAASPGPAAASDVMSERDKLIQGTSSKVGGKKVLDDDTNINGTAPVGIPLPYTINTADDGDKVIDYTISFDIKVEKNLPREALFTVLARGGNGEGSNDQRPHVYLKSTADAEEYCTLSGIALRDCYENRATRYNNVKNNRIMLSHKPSAGVATEAGPQAGEDYKNCTIVVRSTGELLASSKIWWDSTVVGEADSAAADWGLLSSDWKWAWGQTAVRDDIGYVKIKNAYIFGRALDDDEVAVLQGRGATASTYVTEPKTASWKFNPTGYESD